MGLLALLLMLGAGTAVLAFSVRRQAHLAARIAAVRYKANTIAGPARPWSSGGVADVIAAVGSGIARSRILSPKTLAGLEQTLTSKGLRGSNALGLFVGTKLVLLLVMPLLALTALHYVDCSPLMRNIGIALAAMAGLLGPDQWIQRRHKKYLRAITRGLPDALDLMVICAEAGLGFEPAIARVASEIRTAHPAISNEFGLTASELRVASDTKVALNAMGARTGLEGIKRIASILAQTMQYGTPLSDALRVLSTEMRHEMLIRFETRAARLPVLLTLPMIMFILPCIFLIVGGPAAIQALHAFTH
jgi:tight adherence protein C